VKLRGIFFKATTLGKDVIDVVNSVDGEVAKKSFYRRFGDAEAFKYRWSGIEDRSSDTKDDNMCLSRGSGEK
jgi:hypothetical protein